MAQFKKNTIRAKKHMLHRHLTKKTYPLLFAGIAGIMYSLAFPVFSIFILGFFFMIPLFYQIEKFPDKSGFFIFFWFDLVANAIILYWIPGVMIRYGGMSRLLSYASFVLMLIMLGAVCGCAGLLIAKFIRTYPRGWLAVPFIWIAKDLWLEHLVSGFPWSPAGYTQFNNILFIQNAEFGGVHLVTFLLVCCNILIYLFWQRRSPNFLKALAVLLSGIYVLGFLLMQADSARSRKLPVHRAGIVQSNSTHNQSFSSSEQTHRLTSLFRESAQLVRKKAEFVVWPEFTVSIYPLQSPDYRRMLLDFAEKHAPLLAGFTDWQGSRKIYNSLMLFQKNTVTTYNKIHLTPFGEYIPYRKLFFFVRRITDEISDFTPGREIKNLQVNNVYVSTPVCYEIIFPALVRNLIKTGGQLIVTVSNDSWFGDTSAPMQHFTKAVFRSIENRRFTLRSTSNGISGAVSSSGEILYRSAYGCKDSFIIPFRFRRKITFFTRAGYLFPWICLVLTLIFMAAHLVWNVTKNQGRNHEN